MRFRASISAAVISLCASIGWATDACEVADWAPANSLGVMAWAGSGQASQGFAESRLGQLWAEPSVKEFLTQPASSGWAWMRKAIAEKTTPERADAIQGLLSQLWHQPVMACAFPVEKDQDWPLSVGFGVVWQTDPQSESRAKVLLAWIAEEEEMTLPHRTISGIEFTKLGKKEPVWFARQNDKWILAFGEKAAATMAKQSALPSGFLTNDMNRRARKALGDDKPFYYSCVNSRAIRTIIEQEATAHRSKSTTQPSGEPRTTGFTSLVAGAVVLLGGGTFGSQEFATAVRFDGPYLHRTSYARTDKERPLPFDFFGSKPLDRAWLNEIPGDACYVSLGTWEPRQVYTHTLALIEDIMRAVDSTAPTSQPAEGLTRKISDFLGFDPEKEILPHIGESFVMYTQTPTGMLPGVVLVAELRDGKALQARIDKLVAKLPKEISFQDLDVEGETLHLLNLASSNAMALGMFASPCWAITDNRLILSLQQSGARQYLQNRASTQPAMAPIARKPAIPGFPGQVQRTRRGVARICERVWILHADLLPTGHVLPGRRSRPAAERPTNTARGSAPGGGVGETPRGIRKLVDGGW